MFAVAEKLSDENTMSNETVPDSSMVLAEKYQTSRRIRQNGGHCVKGNILDHHKGGI